MQRQDYMLTREVERLGATVLDSFMDPDVTGSMPMAQRPRGGALLRFLAQRPPGDLVVITTEQDRIGRDTPEIIGTIRTIWEAGAVPCFAGEGGLLPRTPHNEFVVGVKASTAQLERDMLRHRITTKLQSKREAGELCGTVSYGWDAVATGRVTPKGVAIRAVVDHPVEQRWIQHMQILRAAGYSYKAIADALNAMNIPSKNAGQTCHGQGGVPFIASGRWGQGQVRKVLTSRMVRDWTAAREALPKAA